VFWPLSEILQGIKSASAHTSTRLPGRRVCVGEGVSGQNDSRAVGPGREVSLHLSESVEAGVAPMTEDYPWLWTPDNSGEHTRLACRNRRLRRLLRVRLNLQQKRLRTPNARAGLRGRSRLHARARALPSLRNQSRKELTLAFRVIADHMRTLASRLPTASSRRMKDVAMSFADPAAARELRAAPRLSPNPFFTNSGRARDTIGDVFPEIRANQKKH